MSATPEISVIMGFRDWGVDRLRLAVRSHRRCTLESDLEVIVVDYGSRDAGEVRRTVEEEGAQVVRVEAAGRPWSRSRALNYGIRQAARGNLILTTDSDILFSPCTAETILAGITKASGTEGTYALVAIRDLPQSYAEERLHEFDWASMEAVASLRPRYGGGCVCFPRSFVEIVRGYDERMEWWGAEDVDLARRAEAAGIEICWVEHPDARIYHLWHEKILEKHRDDAEFQKTWARNRRYLTGSRTLYRNLDEWGGLCSPPVPVSVVIVARDGTDRLERAIDSVLGQTYQNFELIVVGNGSERRAREIVESFSDPRIRWLAPPRSKLDDPANLGVRAARGAHVYVLDDRDRMLPGCIEDHLCAIVPGSAGSFGGRIDVIGKSRDLRYDPGTRPAPRTRNISPDDRVASSVMARRDLALPSAEADPVLGSRPDEGFEHTGTYVLVRRIPAGDTSTGPAPAMKRARAKQKGTPQAMRPLAERAIDIPRVSRPEIASLFPDLFAQTPKLDDADPRLVREKSPGQPEVTRQVGLTRGVFSRRAHRVFLLTIATLGGILAVAWIFRILDAGGFVLGITLLGAAYAVGILMLWLERSIASEVIVLANRIEQEVKDQAAGMRAQAAEDVQRTAAQLKTLTNLIHTSRMIQGLELSHFTHLGSDRTFDDVPYLIVRCIYESRPSTIVLLGMGPTAVILAACLTRLGMDAVLHSIEHDRHRLDETRRILREHGLEERVKLVLAPIGETRFGRFYAIDAWIAGLERVDLLIVGGPPLEIGPQICRSARDYFHPILSDGATVLIDDGRREGRRDDARSWKLEHPELSLEFVDTVRGCFMLRKPAALSQMSFFDEGSQFLAAPGYSPTTTKALSIGGMITTGTSRLKTALMACEFATTTGKYEDGRNDPDCPSPWAEGNLDPAYPASEAFQAWVESYCRGPWFIEKTPERYLHFLAIQKRLGPNRSFFLMMQRDPYQALARIQRRCPERYGLGPCHPPGRILADDPGLIRRLRQAIDFHERLRPHLQHFRYVRYEELCADPEGTLSAILGFLGVGAAPRALERAARLANHDIRRYPIAIEAERLREAANRLCRYWGYPEL